MNPPKTYLRAVTNIAVDDGHVEAFIRCQKDGLDHRERLWIDIQVGRRSTQLKTVFNGFLPRFIAEKGIDAGSDNIAHTYSQSNNH